MGTSMEQGRQDGAAAAVAQAVEGLRDEAVALLQTLIRFPSENPKLIATSAPAERPCQDYLRGVWEGLGCTTETWDALPGRPDLVGVLKGAGSGRSLLFNGHIDVVPAGDPALWPVDPWSGEVRDGEVWGRGACDMKGGLVAMTIATRAIQAAGLHLQGDLILES